jgi:hypothetical protein
MGTPGAAGATGATGPAGPTGATGPTGPQPWLSTDGTPDTEGEDIYRSGRVGIGTTDPNAPLEVSSTNAGVILPRLSSDAAATSPQMGMVIYDMDASALKYYDGEQWISLQSNSGQVKINGYDIGAGEVQPTISLAAPSGGVLQFEELVYDTDPAADIVAEEDMVLAGDPTTTWPANVEVADRTPSQVYEFADDTFLENPIPGQAHIWRLILSYTKGAGGTTFVLRIENPSPSSSFIQEQQQTVTGESSVRDGTLVFNVLTIADSASIGSGYAFSIAADDAISSVTLESVTRFSLQK